MSAAEREASWNDCLTRLVSIGRTAGVRLVSEWYRPRGAGRARFYDPTVLAETVERELKLVAKKSLVWPPDLPGEPLEPRVFDSIYLDTPRRSLARSGITLRRRVENGSSLWQLKLPAGAARRELEIAGRKALPRELRALLRAHLACGSLEQLATLRTERSGIRVHTNGRAVADVVLDEVDAVAAAGRATRFRELEIELVDGDEQELLALRQALVAAGARATPLRPKLHRVLDRREASAPDRTAPPIEHVRHAIRRHLGLLLARDVALRLGYGVEDLHDFRVATRRLRAVLRAARSLLGAERIEPLRGELGWLGSQVGPARDLDVMLEELAWELEALPAADRSAGDDIVDLIATNVPAARAGLARVLASRRYALLVVALDELAHDASPAVAKGSVLDLARRDFRQLAKAIAALGANPPDDALHAARIRVKRARYSAELAGPLAPRPVERLVDSLKELQDTIGRHQDAAVLDERLRQAARAADTPAVGLVAGMLVERQRQRRAEARAAVPAAWPRVARAAKKVFD